MKAEAEAKKVTKPKRKPKIKKIAPLLEEPKSDNEEVVSIECKPAPKVNMARRAARLAAEAKKAKQQDGSVDGVSVDNPLTDSDLELSPTPPT